MMKENANLKLEKEYSVSPETFREGYLAYQKKFLLKREYIFMALFLLLGADMLYSAVKDPSNKLSYVLLFVCLAFAFRCWYNPRKARREMSSTFEKMGKQVYRLRLYDTCAEISTVSSAPVVEAVTEDGETEAEELPAPSDIEFNEDFSLEETETAFLFISGKQVFYIVPKAEMSGNELEIIRSIGKK